MLGIVWIFLLIAINGALLAIIPIALIYRTIKKCWPNWKIIAITGSTGGIIAVFFL